MCHVDAHLAVVLAFHRDIQHFILGIPEHVGREVLLCDREHHVLLIRRHLLIAILLVRHFYLVGEVYVEVAVEVGECELERLVELFDVQLDCLADELAQIVLVQLMRLDHVLTQVSRLRVRPLQDLRCVLQYLPDDVIVFVACLLYLLPLSCHCRVDLVAVQGVRHVWHPL